MSDCFTLFNTHRTPFESLAKQIFKPNREGLNIYSLQCVEIHLTIVSAFVEKCIDNASNTAPFNATGHPALSLNAGFYDGLPVGVMLVGRHFDDVTVLKVGHALEQIRDI